MGVIKNHYILGNFIISFIALIVSGSLIFSFLVQKGGSAFHWDVYRSIAERGSVGDIWLLLLVAFIVVLMNGFFAFYLYTRERFLSQLFSFSTSIFSILILIAISAIIYFN